MDETSEDIWDDKPLADAYDKAMNAAYKKILEKLKDELSLDEDDVKHILGEDTTHSKKKKNEKLSRMWRVGEHCRCIFSEDGQEYEAIIVSMAGNKHCLVRYIGYDNEETVLLQDLAPSLGSEEIRSQEETAAECRPASDNRMWRVGEHCRCIYSHDGEEYEAKIVSMVGNKRCRVKYIGYDNEETVLLQDLAPSWGSEEIRYQEETAAESRPASDNRMWRVGEHCRCIYSHDGEEYEAKIVSMVGNKRCRVKYIGYDNEENVLLQDLAPSLGSEEIRSQEETAAECRPASDYEEEEVPETETMDESLPEKDQEFCRKQYTPRSGTFNGMTLPFPTPPTLPFSLLPSYTMQGEDLNSMLQSSFTSGYYTGYYAALEKYKEGNTADAEL